MAADDHFQTYNNTFETLEELNQAIAEAGSILEIVDWEEYFAEANPDVVGTENFFGKDWQK